MVSCGNPWQPTAVRRVIQALGTSTGVAKVSTDEGIAYLKGIGNPAGLDSLATELVGTELARWIGLQTPDFAIISVNNIDIPLRAGGSLQYGPMFASRDTVHITYDGDPSKLSRLLDPEAVSRLVVFDSWIRNGDRHHPDENLQIVNRDNLFFSPRGRDYELIAIDHSHCFVAGTLADEIGDPEVRDDDGVYGLFPEFRPLISPAAIGRSLHRLSEIDTRVAGEIVGSIPSEWGVTARTRQLWVEVICQRAQHVLRYLPHTLFDQMGLGI